MLSVNKILKLLNYSASENFRTDADQFELDNRHYYDLLRKACEKSDCVFEGIMMFDVASQSQIISEAYSPKPLLAVASAQNPMFARNLHKLVWNIGSFPFLLLHLPNQIRLYSGFSYSEKESDDLLKCVEDVKTGKDILSNFSDISEESVKTGRLWQSDMALQLDLKKRVNYRLLKNLKELSKDLRESLDSNTAHSLIGKYIYIRYLRDRKILSDEWLQRENIKLSGILGKDANLTDFRKLVFALEERFNGKIFDLDLSNTTKINDKHVRLVAEIITGSEIKNGFIQQVFSFMDYDFAYIPVETLSIVYQQFLHAEEDGKEKGAFYTPEPLADYLLSQMEAVSPLTLDMKILDPSCGSGIFLVLAYRRLIELYRRQNGKDYLKPTELRSILLESIYGVEMNLDACNVTAFSLILTLLNYVDPPDLHRHPQFKFPSLVNDGSSYDNDDRIFKTDFFASDSAFACLQDIQFNRITGNPPWIDLRDDNEDHISAIKWIEAAKGKDIIVNDNRLQDAFACKALEHIDPHGLIGFVMPSSSLFILNSKVFRKKLFEKTQFEQITNFSNIRDILFESVRQPATIWIYRPYYGDKGKHAIAHFAPMQINQTTAYSSKLIYITIHDSEIQYIEHEDAETGEGIEWKLAMWGTYRHKRAYQKIHNLFPYSLNEYCSKKGWGKNLPVEGSQFRNKEKHNIGKGYVYLPEYIGSYRFDENEFNANKFCNSCLAIPPGSLVEMSEKNCWLRLRGGKSGLSTLSAPHLLISTYWKNHIIFSDTDFILPPRQMGISCPERDKIYLKAITLFLFSNLAHFCIFLSSPKLGIYTTYNIVETQKVREIPVPDFSHEQARVLSSMLDELIRAENERNVEDEDWEIKRQKNVDQLIYETLAIPQEIQLLVEDFMSNRVPLNETKTIWKTLSEISDADTFHKYSLTLRDELDEFVAGKAFHKIAIYWSPTLVNCQIKVLTDHWEKIQPIIEKVDNEKVLGQFREMNEKRTSKVTPEIYLRKSVRTYEGADIQLFKTSRRIDFSYSSALADADDIIAEIVRET